MLISKDEVVNSNDKGLQFFEPWIMDDLRCLQCLWKFQQVLIVVIKITLNTAILIFCTLFLIYFLKDFLSPHLVDCFLHLFLLLPLLLLFFLHPYFILLLFNFPLLLILLLIYFHCFFILILIFKMHQLLQLVLVHHFFILKFLQFHPLFHQIMARHRLKLDQSSPNLFQIFLDFFILHS